ncbi:8da3e1f7-754a-45f5-89ff-639e9e20ce8d [Sclerotinia trifoliorum]|uniref:8da3e1f7-754a-45f5-89ff-639e9e20ce8d n=1 Tax=Sclerotinia trifoliorum TaxID=28548 RepID=A0A8H2VR77_9HELO|nr:8da3e1f7-754a-45f5-89ff-639e9e20ce8d [Sclerotinia trifoliorum]
MAVSAIQGVTMSTVRADLESINTDQALWLQNWEANKWCDVDENGVAGGAYIYDPVVVSLPGNKIHCFALGLNSNVFHKWYSPSSGWSAWTSMDKGGISAPIAVKHGVDNVSVFVVGFDNLAWVGLNTSDTAFTWKAVGDRVKTLRGGSLSACAYDGRLELIGIENSTGLVVQTYTSPANVWANSWTTWAGSGFCVSNPVIVSCKALCLDIFVFGETHTLKRLSYRGGETWGSWQDCLGTYLYDPTAVSVSPGRIDVFGIGADGKLYQNYVTITGMEVGTLTQKYIGELSISSPKTLVTSPGVFAVTTESVKGVYQQKFYESSNGVWAPQNA